MSLRLLLIAVLLVVAGCAATPGKAVPANDTPGNDTPADTMPADFAGEVNYGNGSVAPPYHYEWRVEFDTRTARLTWSPGYAGTETWTETVDLDAGTREALYDRLHQAGLFEFPDEPDDGLVGGPTGHATFGDLYDGALGTSEAGQDMLDEVVAATEDVFPDQVWAAMEQRQRDWEARQPK
jgi:hypothetical protein